MFLCFGFFLLIKSADVLVDGAAGLAKKFKIPKMVVGLTLIAFATSAPEATVSILASLQDSADLSIGNVIGSNMANVALVLGSAAILSTLPVSKSTLFQGVPLSILAMSVLIIMGYDQFFQNGDVTFNELTLGDGLILLFFFVIFMYYIYGDFKSTQVKEEEIEKKELKHYRDTFVFLILMFLGGTAGILVGGKLVVDQAVTIATYLGVSEALIGLTLVALGTSLPELVTSIVAALKHEKDIAVGNIVGSNVFNVFLVLGLSSIISPMKFDSGLLLDAIFTLVVTVIFFVFLIKEKGLTRNYGFILVGIYFVYIFSVAFREMFVGAVPV